MNKLFSIAKNTFIETLRQPVYAIILIAGLLLIIVSPSVSMYTLDDDNKLLRELGLSTLFLASLFIAIFAASGAIGEEIENKTILTVLSKPVRRPVFILAKFLGVTGAVALAHYVFTIAILMVIRHGVLESVNDEYDLTVITAGALSILGALLLSAFFNYAYDWKFTSTAIAFLAVFASLSMIFLVFIDENWRYAPKNNGFNMFDVNASVLLFLASVIIVALAVALSARFNVIVTLLGCIGIFMLGLVSDWAFGRFAGEHLWAKICYFVVPNMQVFWVSDAIVEDNPVPVKYILIGASYALCYSAGILSLAVAFFQRRQVG
jgi:ABC-type transport system involved in multi-copper enzyme maturation permease subunit